MPHELLKDFRHTFRQPVAWGDMDAFNHVNNSVYFRYMESARIDYLTTGTGLLESLAESGLSVVVGETRCRFRIPVTYPDTLEIGIRSTEIQENRFITQYTLVSEKLGKIVAEGEAIIVCISMNDGRKASLPDSARERLQRLENPFC